MNVLVVAFDGLDYELIQEHECQNVMQSEFGRIDNTTSISARNTSELYASFITGETHEVHGATDLAGWEDERTGKFIDMIASEQRRRNIRGFQRIYEVLKAVFGNRKIRYRREHLQCPTMFDRVPNAKALFVPGYNPSWDWMCGAGTGPLNYGASVEQTEQSWEKEFQWRKQRLFDELAEDPYSLLMCHFHKPDIWQHLYGDDKAVYRPEKLQQTYEEMDELAAEIITKASDRYDWILFMSDHGLPTATQHNENAFYSSNIELGLKEPHITDFHDFILEWVDQEDAITAVDF